MPPAFQRYVIYNSLGWSMYHMCDWGMAEKHYKYALRSSPQPPLTDHASHWALPPSDSVPIISAGLLRPSELCGGWSCPSLLF